MTEFKVSDPISFFEIDRDARHQTLTNVDLDEFDVAEAISSLSLNSAPGPYGLQANILKSCVDELAHPLCLLLRQMFSQGSIPYPLKLAAIVPIFRGGDRTLQL